MPTITDPANTGYDFGYDFDYAVWPIGTQLDLVNVPWNNDYRDVVKFANQTALNAYIDRIKGGGITVDKVSYIKPNQPVKINAAFNRVVEYNYLRVYNPIQPIPGGDKIKYFYYFILDVRYNAPNTTELVLQLDVWQTYIDKVQLGNCYVERGHIGIANTKQFDKFGRDYLTVPEGLDIGGEYQSGKGKTKNFGFGAVLACSTVDLEANPFDSSTPPKPVVHSATGTHMYSSLGGIGAGSTGTSYYYWANQGDFMSFLSDFSDKPWVTQGIVAAYVIPPLGIKWTDGGGLVDAPTIHGKRVLYFKFNPTLEFMWPNWRNDSKVTDLIPDRYKGLKKLWTYPYMVVELTTYLGKPLVLKPESWNADDADVITRASFGNPQQRIDFAPNNYNHLGDALNTQTDLMPFYNGGEYFDVYTSISNFPSLPIVNNGTIAYLSANYNSIAFQYQSADWTQQRALGMNQASYDIASGGIQASRALTSLANMGASAQTGIANAALDQTRVNNAIAGVGSGVANGIGMAGSGAPMLGVAGAAQGAIAATQQYVNTGVQMNANSQAVAVGNAVRSGSTGITTGQDTLVRDTNKSVADWAAKGDYANQIAGINAKVQDARMIQPTTSGQLNGEFANLLNGMGYSLTMIVKAMQGNAMKTVGEYWLRFGYAIHQFMTLPTNYMVMTKFTYWKLTQTYIRSATVPEGFKQAIRGIFEKGVTVWANPDDIGVIDNADNQPLPGISY